MATPTQPPARPTVQGSWEDHLTRAQELASNMNAEAIPAYRKIVDGLLRLPKSRLDAGGGRLRELLEIATLALLGEYNIRDRFDDSLALIDQTRPFFDKEDDETDFDPDSAKASILLMAERQEEAFDLLASMARAEDALYGDWYRWIMVLSEHGRRDEAAAAMSELEAAVEAGKIADFDDLERRGDRDVALNGLRSFVAFQAGDWDSGWQLALTTLADDSFMMSAIHAFYQRLVIGGQYERAERLIERDTDHPIRAGFWRGLVQRLQEHDAAARQAFHDVTGMNIAAGQPEQIQEYVLAHLYLGEAEQVAGLEFVLRLLRERLPDALLNRLYYLAGIAWARRDNLGTARHDLDIALRFHKGNGLGRRLPYLSWFMARGALPAEAQSSLERYFESAPPWAANP